jgi:hypothetical protein
MKGAIQSNHIPVNHWELIVPTLPALTITEQSGLEDELEKVKLPDRTVASGGNRGPVEIDITMPMHHITEQLAMEVWFRESQQPVLPTYKKAGTLIHYNSEGNPSKTFGLIGVFPFKRTTSDLEMENEGAMATVVWSLSIDDVEYIAG